MTNKIVRQKKPLLHSIEGGRKNPNGKPLRAIVVGVTKQASDVAAEAATSRQLDLADPWGGLGKQIIPPPLDPLLLSMMTENNSELGPVIEAMEVNIEGFGNRYVPTVKPEQVKKNPKVAGRMIKEKTFLTNFFNNCSHESSFKAIRRQTRKDLESTGNGWWEFILDTKGLIRWIEWAPAYTMRIMPLDSEAVEAVVPQIEVNEKGMPTLVLTKRWIRFRKYVQCRDSKIVYYKQLGDPRMMDWRDGEYKERLQPKYRANAMYQFKIPVSRTPYGLPRYIGNLFSLFGSRAAEEINFTTLKNNNVPSMVVAVSGGGMLTEGTINRVTDFVENNIKGDDNYSKFLILEAEPMEEGALPGQSENVKINITPLSNEQIHDAMFQAYDEKNCEKVRGAFRMPPIFVGRSKDYNRATADTSRALSDEQIFAPERDAFDDIMNAQVLPRLGIVYHQFKSNSPNTTNNQDLIKMMAGAEKTGGLTPRISREIMSDIFGKELGEVEAIEPDIPFTMQVAEAAKNTGPVNLGTIAPMKSMIDGSDVVESLMGLRTAISKAIKEEEQ